MKSELFPFMHLYLYLYDNYDWVDKKRRCKVNFSLLSAQQSLSNFSLIFPTFVFVFVFVIVFV